jgi:hypothetical protein
MSTLKVNTLQTAAGVEVYTAKAWVNFNGTGTVAIRGSGNVTNITDNGTGDYTVNFTTAMPDANYCLTYSISSQAGTIATTIRGYSQSTGSTRIQTLNNTQTAVQDSNEIGVAIFR